MKIKTKQPDVTDKLTKLVPQKISRKDIKDCMRHDAYRRKGGAIKQIKWE